MLADGEKISPRELICLKVCALHDMTNSLIEEKSAGDALRLTTACFVFGNKWDPDNSVNDVLALDDRKQVN